MNKGTVIGLSNFNGIFLFKPKTAYELRISDWSSDVCSSDLGTRFRGGDHPGPARQVAGSACQAPHRHPGDAARPGATNDAENGSLWLPIGRASCRERVCKYV